ncbi:PREDICTED: WD repeat-containing protein 47-like, partial [Rhagoletis zephyria]|uniref:WD repeat-containing protein 47-like n=1 Tax=Rhagoletis zephyria TaxID=28612 RepID=UPI000811AACD
HGLRSSLSSPSPHPNHLHHHQHSQHSQHTSHQHSVDLSNDNDTNNTTNEAIRFVSVANFEDQQAIRTAEFHPSGRYFAIGSNSKQLRVFQYSSQDSNNNTADSDISPPELIFKRPKYHKGSIYCLAWNKIGNLLATGSNDKTIKLATFNPESPSFLSNEAELPVHDGTVRDLCFMDDLTNGSSLLLSGGAGDCKINITDCETATTFLSLSGHSGPVLSLYTWGGAMFVSGSQDRTIRFWDLRSNSCINFVTCPTISRTKPGGAVAAVSVDPTGKLLVSGHEDSTCMLYDVRGGRVIQTFHPHSADIRTLRFSSKAYYLLSGGYDNKIVLTDMQGDLTQPLKSVVVAEHEDKVIQCRWHPTEFVFLSTSADKTAKLWALPD